MTPELEAIKQRIIDAPYLRTHRDMMLQVFAALTAAERRAEAAERDVARLLGHMGSIAAAVVDDNSSEAYHQCYLAIVKDLDLPAETQSALMEVAIDAAREREKL